MGLDKREDFFLQLLVDHVLFDEILLAANSLPALRKMGIKYGLRAMDQYLLNSKLSEKLNSRQFAGFLESLTDRLGGDYRVKTGDNYLDISCYACPFGKMSMKCPSLCEIMVGIIGGAATYSFPYAKVCKEQTMAQRAAECRFRVYLQRTDEAHLAKGEEFISSPTAYLYSRQEILALRDLKSTQNEMDKLQSAHRNLEREFNQLRNEIFSDLELGVITVNESGEINFLNTAAIILLHINSPAESEALSSFLRLLKETITQRIGYNQYILQIQFPAGAHYFSVNTAPLYSEHGTVQGAVGVFQDITRKRIMENELLQMEKFSLVAELAAGTAHEIRNPMTTLRGFLQIFTGEFSPGSKGYEYCSLMIDEIDRANAIIKEFLLLTKPAAPHMQKTDLHVILNEILLLIETKSLLENVLLDKIYANNLPPVNVDQSQIKQVFLNMATNAIQAMPEGGKLTIVTAVQGASVVVRFEDTGCGMDEAQIAKMFDPFFTTKEEGTGLGLTISYRIVENHGGRIYAESSPGCGTTFAVVLPAAAE